MEPMRPVEVTEAPVDARATRRRIWWTIVLAITLSVQVVFVVGYGVSYWWAVAFGGLMWAFYEGFFWLSIADGRDWPTARRAYRSQKT